MITFLRHIQRNLVWAIPVVMLAGFFAGVTTDVKSLKQLILPFTFLMVYPMMVNLQIKKIFEGGDAKVQIVTQLLNFAVIPFMAFALGKIAFPNSPYITLGLLLASLLPTSGMTISWTGMAHGNIPAAIKMTVFGLLIGSVLTPLYVKSLMGTVIEIPLVRIFKQILIVVLLPLVLGNITQQLLVWRYGQAKYQKDIKGIFPLFSTLGVLGVVFIALSLKAESIAANPVQLAGLILPLIILYGMNFTISTVIGKMFFSRGDAIALVYGTVMRNLSIALAIAMTVFGKEGSQIALIIALAYIVQVQSAAWYVKLTHRIFGEKIADAKAREVMLEGVFALHLSDTLSNAVKLLAEEHIHSVAILDDNDKPVGMVSGDSIINAVADDFPYDTPLGSLSLDPVVIVAPGTPLKTMMESMKRAHEYKALVLDAQGRVSHVIPQEELLLRLVEETPEKAV